MSDLVWGNASMSASDVMGAVTRADPGQESNVKTDPLDDQVLPALIRAANFLEGFPETQDYTSQIREIAFRYKRGRPTPAQWRRDCQFARELHAEMFKRATAK